MQVDTRPVRDTGFARDGASRRFDMAEEARLEDVGSGLAPVSDGWFVVNVRDAAWLMNDAFGARCVFEGGMPVLRRRPDLPAHRFADVGFTLQVIQPGQPSGLYHAETNQEDFLVPRGRVPAARRG
jgi:hypothetical protein